MVSKLPVFADALAFLQGGGQAADLIAKLDWAATSLGPLAGWAQTRRATVSLVLRSHVPIVTLWGKDGVMIYNDAYAEFAGARHPQLLGSRVREGWVEVADFNDNVMRVCLAGGTLAYRDQELTLARHGRPERVWLDLDYSPILDDAGRPCGVVAIVTETTRKVLAQRSMKQIDAQLRRAQEAGRVGVFTIDLVEDTLSATPELCRLFGLPVAQRMPAAVIQQLVIPADRPLVSTHEQRRTGSTPLEVEYRIRRADTGEERALSRKAEYEFDADGRPVRFVGIVHDVTERRAVQRALDESAAQFRGFAQSMPNQAWACGPDGLLDWFNDQVYLYSGAAFGELDGTAWSSLVHPDDLEPATARWAAALRSGKPYEVEFRLRRADGEFRWHVVRAVPIRDASQTITRWIGTNTDIHERKLAETESARDRDRIWSLSPVLMLVTSTSGVIANVNPAWVDILGWPLAASAGKHFLDFVDAVDRDAAADCLAALRRQEAVRDLQLTFSCKSAERRQIVWSFVRESASLYGFGRDVTEQRTVEEALRQSQKMEAVGQLTGGIAHDFNNLLQGITGSLDLVQKRIVQGRLGELDRFISGAMTSANRASALTHRLLAFSRRQPLDPRPVRANPLVASMEDLLRRTLGERIELELVLAGGLWLTRCDPNQLESAILNLAINARDAMPVGGKLVIETCNAHLDLRYAARQREVRPGQYICICVTDTGTGMSPDVVARAFEPFFTTKPIGQGTGLGLSMIYGFARQSEGYAKIYSEPGKGSTLKIYLPRHRGAAEPDDEVAYPPSVLGAQSGETVLVVEDEPVVRGLIVEVLHDLGYHALEAADGPKGLEILQSKHRIDLLVTDVGLPGLNGRQVADAGRLLRPGLRVLFMTGYAENAALAAGFLEPGMQMVTKPFAMDVLTARIRDMLKSK